MERRKRVPVLAEEHPQTVYKFVGVLLSEHQRTRFPSSPPFRGPKTVEHRWLDNPAVGEVALPRLWG